YLFFFTVQFLKAFIPRFCLLNGFLHFFIFFICRLICLFILFHFFNIILNFFIQGIQHLIYIVIFISKNLENFRIITFRKDSFNMINIGISRLANFVQFFFSCCLFLTESFTYLFISIGFKKLA